MDTLNKDFEAGLPSIGMRLRATGFTGSCRFVSVAIGTGVVNSGEYSLLVSPAEARAMADAFSRAADYAEPRDSCDLAGALNHIKEMPGPVIDGPSGPAKFLSHDAVVEFVDAALAKAS